MIGELLREFPDYTGRWRLLTLSRAKPSAIALAFSLSCHFSVYRRKLSRRAEWIHPWAELINLMRGLVEPQQDVPHERNFFPSAGARNATERYSFSMNPLPITCQVNDEPSMRPWSNVLTARR